MNHIVGILLAAGQGKRFGGDKCLAPLSDGTPMALRAAQQLQSAVGQVLCVVRPNDVALKALLQANGFRTVDSVNAAKGMSESLKAGIQASADAQAWVIALADMPLIKTETHQQLLEAFCEHGGVVRPAYQAQAGHPVVFAQEYVQDLLSISGDEGAKSVLKQHAQAVHLVPVDDAGVLQDFDTQESLQGV